MNFAIYCPMSFKATQSNNISAKKQKQTENPISKRRICKQPRLGLGLQEHKGIEQTRSALCAGAHQLFKYYSDGG
jgi:hypothetical protein